MKFKYVEDETLMNNELRDVFIRFGKKTTNGSPFIVPETYQQSIELLRNINKLKPEINVRVIDSLEKYPRTNFFNWNIIPENIKEQLVNPYTFLSVPFTRNNDTISSIHNILFRGTLLNVDPSDRILYFESKSAYDTIVFSELLDDGKILALELDDELRNLGKDNIKKSKLERKIMSISSLNKITKGVDKITTTYAFRTTTMVEKLLEYLNEGGMARLSIARAGNCSNPAQARYWRPGDNLELNETRIRPDYNKIMVRATSYVFIRDSKDTFRYGFNKTGGLVPLFQENKLI